MPDVYKQAIYTVENSYVWLSTYLMVRSIDPDLSLALQKMFKKYTAKCEWLSLSNNTKKRKETNKLLNFLGQ